MRCLIVGWDVALADGFEEEDGCADRDVQRVDGALHGDEDVGVGSDTPGIGELCGQLGVTLLVKLHQIQRDYNIDFDSMNNIKRITNDDFENNGVNLYELLAVTDALITDYSSVAIDYLIVDKPIGFALEDYEMYKATRGFIFDDPLQYMPGHHMYGIDDLEHFLHDIANGSDPYKADRDRVKAEAIHPSTCYCEEIAKAIFDKD